MPATATGFEYLLRKRPRLVVPVICLTVLACRDPQIRSPRGREANASDLHAALAAHAHDTTLRLIAFAPTDTIRDPDSLRVVVVIWNGGDYRELGDDFYSFSYDVIDSGGTPITPAPLPQVYGIRNVFSLGRGEFSGFTEPLACPQRQADARRDCWWDFRLTHPGEYGIVVHYRTLPPPDVASPVAGRDYLALTSDTVAIEFCPGPKH